MAQSRPNVTVLPGDSQIGARSGGAGGGYGVAVHPADALDRSPEAAARSIVDGARARLSGCCGATIETWWAGRLTGLVCSQPDLGELMAGEYQLPDSPMRSAARTLRTVGVEDTLRDVHWRPFSARALRIGVRGLICAAHVVGDETVTCSLYSLRPGALPATAPVVAATLLQEWTVALAQVSAFADIEAEAHQLSEAMAARELVEQAKGMLMHALNCDAETAYGELGAAAQRAGLKITDVAARMISHRSTPPGPAPTRQGRRPMMPRTPHPPAPAP